MTRTKSKDDWIIDLGPEGGDEPVLSGASSEARCAVEGGGEIVATGTPEQVVKVARSYTGSYLRPLLTSSRASAQVAAE